MYLYIDTPSQHILPILIFDKHTTIHMLEYHMSFTNGAVYEKRHAGRDMNDRGGSVCQPVEGDAVVAGRKRCVGVRSRIWSPKK